jgi:uncharacterized DUF497 family protein
MTVAQHIADHDISTAEVEEVIDHPMGRERSCSSNRPIVFGVTSTGRLLAVIFEEVSTDLVYPITAFDLDE